MNPRINNISILLLTALYVPMLFLGLFDLDEGAFAATSFQMLENNKFLVPIIGEELRLEKPVLTYWIQALSIKVWGANEFALRLPAVLASFFWAYSFSRFIKETDNQASSSEIYLNLLTLPGVFIISFAATVSDVCHDALTVLLSMKKNRAPVAIMAVAIQKETPTKSTTNTPSTISANKFIISPQFMVNY